MPEIESEEYKTVDLLWTVGGWIKLVMEFVEWCWEFGKTNPFEYAMERLERELKEIYSRLEQLNDRIDELVDITVKDENRARVRWLRDRAKEISDLSFELRQYPGDSARAAVIAHKAGGIADLLLTDEDAWLWRDVLVRTRRNEYGDVVGSMTEPLPADFKVALALPVYAGALAIWMAAIRVHTAGDRSPLAGPAGILIEGGQRAKVVEHYGSQLERHIAATGVRGDWRDGRPSVTLPEKIRERIACRPVAHEKYARDGKCTFDVICTNQIDRTSVTVRSLTVDSEPGPSVLCTIDPSVGLLDERALEDEHPAVRALARWNEILRAMHATGTFPYDQKYEDFPSWQAQHVEMYGLGPDGSLLRFTQDLTPAPSTWNGPEQVLSGADHREFVAAGGPSLLAQSPSGDWSLYREGARQAPESVGTVMSSMPSLFGGIDLPPLWRHFGGGYGVMYGVVVGRPNAEYSTGDLYWVRLQRQPQGATTAFGDMRKVGWGWDRFVHLFSTGEGVIYGVLPNGWMQWRRHPGWHDGSFGWDDPQDMRDVDWRAFSRIIPAGDGLIYGMYPNGRLVCFRHAEWRTGGGRFQGPIDVGLGWDAFDHLVAALPAETGGVQ